MELSITSLRGGGRPLSHSERAFFEPRFGADFSDVRVHADSQAGALAKTVQAKAFMIGRDLVFGREEYSPGTAEGGRLLAHELTHVVQQGRGESFVQRAPADDKRWKRDETAARYRGQLMAKRIRTHGILSKEARAKIKQELAYFEGAAWEAYVSEIRPALLRVTPRPEIEMPAEYVGTVDTPGDVLGAIVTIMECAPVSSGESPIAKNPLPESSPCGPAYYTKRNVTKKEYADLLWEWFKIANTWSQTTTSYRTPDPTFTVAGSAGRTQISQAVAKTSPIIDAVSAAGGDQLVARYKGLLATFEKRAGYKAGYEAETKKAEEIHKMDRYEISRQWDTRKADFIAVASRPNKLDAYQLFTIYNRWYGDEYHDRWVEMERVKHELWEKDQMFYAALMVDLEHTGGFFDALMLDLQQGRLREEVKRIYSFGPIDDAAIALVPNLLKAIESFHSLPLVNPEKILSWLETRVDIAGDRLTFQDVYDHAREMAEAQAGWGGIFQQMALGIAAEASMPRPTPGPTRRGMITYPTAATATVAAEAEALNLENSFGELGGPRTGYKIQICDDSTVIEKPSGGVYYPGKAASNAGGAVTDTETKTIWVHESVVGANGIVRKWGSTLNLKQVTAHEVGHATTGSFSCAVASRTGADLPGLTAIERNGLLDDAVHIAPTEGVKLGDLNLPKDYEPPMPTTTGTAPEPAIEKTLGDLGVAESEGAQLSKGVKIWGEITRGRAKLVTYLKLEGKRLTAGVLSSELPKIPGRTVEEVAEEERPNVINAYLSFRRQSMTLAKQLGADTIRVEADVVVNPDLPETLRKAGFKPIPDSPGSYFKEEPVK